MALTNKASAAMNKGEIERSEGAGRETAKGFHPSR